MLIKNLNPILSFNGNAEEAFNFYKSVFGGEFTAMMRWKESPNCGEVANKDQNKIMHVALPVGKNNVLMGSDSLDMKTKLISGNNFTICIEPQSETDADQIFKQLSYAGKVFMPMQKMFWNAYAGMFSDKFGVQWMINYSYTS